MTEAASTLLCEDLPILHTTALRLQACCDSLRSSGQTKPSPQASHGTKPCHSSVSRTNEQTSSA